MFGWLLVAQIAFIILIIGALSTTSLSYQRFVFLLKVWAVSTFSWIILALLLASSQAKVEKENVLTQSCQSSKH